MYAKKYLKSVPEFDSKAIEKLKQYSFPGNVRELQYTMERAVIMSEGDALTATDLLFSPIESSVMPKEEPVEFKFKCCRKKYNLKSNRKT